MGRFETENTSMQQQQQQQQQAAKPTVLPVTKGAAWEELPAAPSGKPQMSEFPDGTMAQMPQRPLQSNFLKRGTGQTRGFLLRSQMRKQRILEFRSQHRQNLQQQQHLQGAFTGQQQQLSGLQNQQSLLEQRLLSKPPLRHWGFQPALVYQPDIDQCPKFTWRTRFNKRHAALTPGKRLRIHRMRHGVAWSIPVYNLERRERAGLSWTIPLDGAFYADVKSTKNKKGFVSKSKGLLKRFTGRVKQLFGTTSKSSAGTRMTVQQRVPVDQKLLASDGPRWTGRSSRWLEPPRLAVRERRPIAAGTGPRFAPRLAKTTPAGTIPSITEVTGTHPHAELFIARPFRIRETFRVQHAADTTDASLQLRSRWGLSSAHKHLADEPLVRQAPSMG